ncbi:MAG: AMP-binding protein [Candidatus Saccharimonadales bacterium]
MSSTNFREFVVAAGNHKNKVALGIKRVFRTETLTYGELRASAYRTAHWLAGKKLTKGDYVVIVAPNTPEWGQLFLACQLLGVIVVPVDVRSSIESVENIAGKVKPKLIFRGKNFLSRLDSKHRTILLEDLPELTMGFADEAPAAQVGSQDQALLVFTSGTTGEPKGVVLTQGNLLANVNSIRRALTILPRWRFLSILPLSHTYELTVGFLAPLTGGASVYYVARLAPLSIARGLRDHRITSMLAVPQLLYVFKKAIETKAGEQGRASFLRFAQKAAAGLPFPLRRIIFSQVIKQLGGLEFVATGSAPVDVEAVKFWERLGIKVLQGYGLTETAPVLTMNTFKERHMVSQGKAIPGVHLRIGEGGEIQAKGDNVFAGYWRNPAATKQAFTPDGWFKTGDVGKIDEHGWLFIRGREKFVIVLASGLKVFPEDVERIADKHPLFKALSIVGVQQPEGEAVHAVAITEAPSKAVDKAIADINSKLESHQQITGWTRWDAEDFPRTRLLKIDRKKVQEWLAERQGKGTVSTKDYLEPAKDKIIDLICIVTESSAAKVTETTKLSELGLDSLRRLTLVSLIEEQLSVSIAEHLIHQNTTVAQLRKLTKSGTLVEETFKRPKWTYWPWTRFFGMLIREAVLSPAVRIWVKATVKGKHNLSQLSGSAIFIFNHVDSFDAVVLYRALPFYIRQNLAIAAAEDVMKKHAAISIAGRLGFAAFDFARKEPFIPSLDYMARLIDKGWNIAIAPEGRLSPNGQQQPYKSGTGMMAVEMQVPVVPVKTKGLYGTVPLHHHWPKRRSKITVEIGKPIRFGQSTPYHEATGQLEEVMKKL